MTIIGCTALESLAPSTSYITGPRSFSCGWLVCSAQLPLCTPSLEGILVYLPFALHGTTLYLSGGAEGSCPGWSPKVSDLRLFLNNTPPPSPPPTQRKGSWFSCIRTMPAPISPCVWHVHQVLYLISVPATWPDSLKPTKVVVICHSCIPGEWSGSSTFSELWS